MSFYDLFHKIFEDFHGGNYTPPRNDEPTIPPPLWDPQKEDYDASDFGSFSKFMKEAFEMQKLFEQQFNDMFKIFSLPDEFFGFHRPDMFQSPNIPTIEGSDPRDYYLKPEYRSEPQPSRETIEKEYDQRSKSMTPWFDGVLPAPSLPNKDDSQPRSSSSFSSVTRITVKLPDGTVKTEEIIRNPDGTDTRTESKTLPDGSHSPNFDTPFFDPGVFFNFPKVPKIKTINPREEFLKPGYEEPNLLKEKVDTDLDQQTMQSGIESLPPLLEEDTIVQPKPKQHFSFRSFSKKTVRLPDGTIETEEIERNSDGTEKKTVTQTLPDGTMKTIQSPNQTDFNSLNEYEKRINGTSSFTLKGIKDIVDAIFKT